MDAAGLDGDECSRTLALFEGGRRLLESLARGAALATVLDDLCRLVERVTAGCRCTVLLVEVGEECMAHGAAPSLPDSYNRCFVGQPATAEFGPCGMAAVLRQQVIVPDIAIDERWSDKPWSRLALDHGLRACWSTPILSPAGSALGTFAVYWSTPGIPGHAHQDVIYQMTHIAAVAIERERAAVALARAGHPRAGNDRQVDAGERLMRLSDDLPPGVDALRGCYSSLTPREREVMTWVVAGLPNKRIGAELGTAEITVKVHRGRVMRKMRAASLADLVRMAARLHVPLPGQALN